MAKSWLTGKDPDSGKDWRQADKGLTEDERVRWYHRLDGHEFQQAPAVGDGQGSLACCSPWGRKELDMTEKLNWTPWSSGIYPRDTRILRKSINVMYHINKKKTIWTSQQMQKMLLTISNIHLWLLFAQILHLNCLYMYNQNKNPLLTISRFLVKKKIRMIKSRGAAGLTSLCAEPWGIYGEGSALRPCRPRSRDVGGAASS